MLGLWLGSGVSLGDEFESVWIKSRFVECNQDQSSKIELEIEGSCGLLR